MMQNSEILLTIVAVIAGWLLNEVSQFFKYKREDKKTVNAALFNLLDLKFILEQLQEIIVAGIQQRHLSPLARKFFNNLIKDDRFNSEKFKEKLDHSVDEISKVDPLTAQKLRVYIDGAQIFQHDILSLRDHDVDMQKEELKIKAQAIELFIQRIDRLIKKLSFRKSKIAWLKIHYSMLKGSKTNSPLWSGFFEDLNQLMNQK